MARLVPLLTHLPPPQWFGKIVLDRFSPYYFEPIKHGLVNVRPSISYTYVYPFSKDRLKKIAYHFDFDYSDDRDVDSYTKMLRLQIRKWKRLWTGQRTPGLNMVRVENLILINDTRPISIQEFYILRDEEARIYEICEVPQTLRGITNRIKDEFSQTTEEGTMNTLCDLVDRKLLLDDNDKIYQDDDSFFGEEPSRFAVLSYDNYTNRNRVRKMLEFGCGQGMDTLFFASKGIEVSALDYSKVAIDRLMKLAKEKNLLSNIHASAYDAKSILQLGNINE